jgi:hypothetical protein
MRIALPLGLASAIVALAISGCGGSDSQPTPASAPSAELQACLSRHGVKIPSPPSGSAPQMAPPSGGSSDAPSTPPAGGAMPLGGGEKTQKAFQACSQYMPQPPSGGQAPPFAVPGGSG